jgi:ribosomal-protein-serine acetyltransferase
MVLIIDNTLSLQLLEDRHAVSIFELVNTNRVHLREWLPWVIKIQTLEHFREYIIGHQVRFTDNSDVSFVIIHEGKVAGRIGVYNIDSINKIGSVGYWLGEDFIGKGIALRSCEQILNYCFSVLFLNRVEIKCATKNSKSQAIPIKLNFKNEGIIRQGEFIHNEYIDLYCFSMLQKEWELIRKNK